MAASGLGAGNPGAELGPFALRIQSALEGYDLFHRNPVEIIQNSHQIRIESDKYHEDYLQYIVDFNQELCESCMLSLNDGFKTLVISGDHSNAVGSISGLRKANPSKKIGVIWIDAHADLHSPYSSPSQNVHGMPLAALCGFDNKESKKQDPSTVIRAQWEELKLVGGADISPKITADDLVFIDIRDLEEEEWDSIHRHNILHFKPDAVKSMGIDAVIEKTKEHLKDKDILYITFDVDSLDPTISKGTGTPVPDGLSKDQAISLLKAFYHDPRTKMLEITEINPLLDEHNAMARTTVDIMKAVGL